MQDFQLHSYYEFNIQSDCFLPLLVILKSNSWWLEQDKHSEKAVGFGSIIRQIKITALTFPKVRIFNTNNYHDTFTS
jgi:predicted metalloprotease